MQKNPLIKFKQPFMIKISHQSGYRGNVPQHKESHI